MIRNNMEMTMWLDYKPTRYEGKGFLRNLNIRIHRDITGDRCGLGWGVKEESPSVSFHGANWTDISNLRLCVIHYKSR